MQEKLDEEKRKIARSLQSKFQNYKIPVLTVNKLSKEEIEDVFNRISKQTKVSSEELNELKRRGYDDE